MSRGPHFVVTGVGRCGTHWVAEAMRLLGHPTGHEDVFGYWPMSVPNWQHFDGDVSWPAAAYFHLLPRTTPLVHLVRDPLMIVGSRLGNNKLVSTFSPPTVRHFVNAVLDPPVAEADPLSTVLDFVCRWDALVETAANHSLQMHRVRIEDISTDLDAFSSCVEVLTGCRPQPAEAQQVLNSLTLTVGSLRSREPVTWRRIGNHALADRLRALADRDGYAVTDS